MLWNIMMHSLIGFLGAHFFTLEPSRILVALLVTLSTQSADFLNSYMAEKRNIEEGKAKERSRKLKKVKEDFRAGLPIRLLKNMLAYSALILVLAGIIRSSGFSLM